ncbi:MAG: hypothetical protein U0694_06510 [Anaerolineae bacterium]
MTDNNWILYLAGFSVICCLIPLAIAAVLVFFAIQRGSEWVQQLASTDPEKMQAQFDKLQREKPNVSREKLVEQFIHSQSLKCGAIGALTSFGGFVTLPLTLPIDLLASIRIQATMVQFIAAAYGQNNPSELEKQVQSYLIMTGGMQLTERTSSLIMKLLVRLLEQFFAKAIPIVGALVGFAVNYFFTRAAGTLAAKWYSGKMPKTA